MVVDAQVRTFSSSQVVHPSRCWELTPFHRCGTCYAPSRGRVVAPGATATTSTTAPENQRSYWVQQDDGWGLFLGTPEDIEGLDEEKIHWVEMETFAASVFPPEYEASSESETAWYSDGLFDWVYYEDEWHTMTQDGWVAYSDMKPWLDAEEAFVIDPVAGKEIQDLYAAYEQKMRTFKEARDLVHQKARNRGYFPYKPPKGSGGFGKGKGKGQSKGKKGSSLMVSQGKGSASSSSPASKPGYTGCFICGDKTHDYLVCPKRGSNANKGFSKGKPKPINYVDAAPEPADSILMVEEVQSPTSPRADLGHEDMQRLILTATTGSNSDPHRLGYAVVDTGATETVGSLQAIEYIVNTRAERYGREDIGVDPSRTKRFKFGNAEERTAESYLLLPQSVNGTPTSLGVYTLDVPNVPLLLGIRTMSKLGAVIDVAGKNLVFTKVFPGTVIPLVRGQNGHLLLDLCKDWSPSYTAESKCMNPSIPRDTVFHSDATCDHEGKQVCADRPQELRDSENEQKMSPHELEDEPHNIHVVETRSEKSIDSLDQEGILTAASLQAQECIPKEPITGESECHGVLPGDSQGDGARTSDYDCQEPHRRDEGNQEDGPEPLRLRSGSVGRSERPTGSQGSMRRPALHSGLLQGIEEWGQQTCPVARMCQLPTSPDVSTGRRSARSLSERRTTGIGCEEPFGSVEAEREAKPERPGNQGLGIYSSRGLSSQESRAHPSPKGEGNGQDTPAQGRRQELSDNNHSEVCQDLRARQWSESQARECSDSRTAGSGGDPRRGLIMEGCEPLKHDFTLLDDDALDPQEQDSGDVSCVHDLPEPDREKIVAALTSACENLQEAFSCIPVTRCDMFEICCGEDSGLVETVLNQGGTAFRVGLHNNMDLSTPQGLERALEF